MQKAGAFEVLTKESCLYGMIQRLRMPKGRNADSNGKTLWTGSIEKLQTKTISIPEGPFTVISKVYNANLKNNEDIGTDSHTRLC